MTAPQPKIDFRATAVISPSRGFVASDATPDQIKKLKQHVMTASAHVARVKRQVAASTAALAALDPAKVNAVVVPGYPPPPI